MSHDEPPILTDITATSRRQARQEAAAVLVAAGWGLSRISLAFGISQGTAQELMPPGWGDAQIRKLWERKL
jgi:hypothetical protein